MLIYVKIQNQIKAKRKKKWILKPSARVLSDYEFLAKRFQDSSSIQVLHMLDRLNPSIQ